MPGGRMFSKEAVLNVKVSTSLVDRVAEQVTTILLDGQLRPGDAININALAKTAGVSVVPVREALARLGAVGLLRFVPNHGYSVAPQLTPERRTALFEAREAIEAAAAPLAIKRRTTAQINILKKINTAIRHIPTSSLGNHQREFFRLNNAFHVCYLEMTHNEYLERAYRALAFDMLMSRDDDARHINYLRLADEHNGIIDALRLRDVSMLTDLVTRHIRQSI